MKNSLGCGPRFKRGAFLLIIALSLVSRAGPVFFLRPDAAGAQDGRKMIFHRHDPLVRAAIDAKGRHMGGLMRIPGVVGTGVGIGPDGRPAVKVFTVRHGVPGIPKALESIPVDVEVTGMIVAMEACPTGYCSRPVPIGASTGHPHASGGTIGARVRDQNGNVYALSNNHVYANRNNAQIGDGALQPGVADGASDTEYFRIGHLYAFQPIDFSGPNTIDAAIISTTANDLDRTTVPDGYGIPGSQVTAAAIGMPVKKYGRTTHLTHGRITDINVTISVCYANCSNPSRAQTAWFEDQIGIVNNDAGSFSLGGDSGSLIVTEEGNSPVGLLFAGTDARTFANRIDLVLDRFGVTIDDGTAGLNQPPVADFSYTATGVTASFTDRSVDADGTVREWSWVFGDGSTSTAQNPTHIYPTGGSYSVTLTVKDNAGGEGIRTRVVSVSAAPTRPSAPGGLRLPAISSHRINSSRAE